MEIGEIIGILFLVGAAMLFVRTVVRANSCPRCRAFWSTETVEVVETRLDTEETTGEVAFDILFDGDRRNKSTKVEWVDRCRKCGYETQSKRIRRHR